VGGKQVEMLDQSRHGGVAAVLLLQLQREAFAQVAGKHAARLEALHHRQGLLDEIERRAEQLAKRCKIALQVPGLIGHVDEMMADQPAGRVGEDKRELIGKMVLQRPLLGDIGFEIWRIVAVEARALA
jgi:hypothetical protein